MWPCADLVLSKSFLDSTCELVPGYFPVPWLSAGQSSKGPAQRPLNDVTAHQRVLGTALAPAVVPGSTSFKAAQFLLLVC